MNNLLSHKNEEAIKRNSADFYTMTVYSKDILGLDYIRLKSFKDYLQVNKINSLDDINLWNNKFKILTSLGVSFILMYKFKSVLVIPLFPVVYLMSKRIITGIGINYPNTFLASDCGNDCYFCKSNQFKMKQLEDCEKYFHIIDYVLERNNKITNLQEFEDELDKLFKKNKKF